MNKELKNLIKRLKDIKLSETEKSVLRSKISEFMSFNPIRGEAHIPKERMYISIFEVGHFVKATALVLIFAVVIGGSGVSYAASNALPGDALYGIKVNVNEKIEGGLAFSSGTKVAVESKKVERRLEEAQALVKGNKLSTENKELLQEKIEEHIKDLEKEIDALKKDGDYALVLETTGKLAPVLEIHKDILIEKSLDENADEENSATLIATVENSIEKMTAEENDVLAFALDSEETADASASSISMMSVSDEPEKTAEQIAEEKVAKEAKEAIEEISADVKEIVEDRIESAKDKIRTLKAEQELMEKEAIIIEEKPAVITPIEVREESPMTAVEITSKTETKETVTLPSVTETDTDVEVVSIKPVEFDISAKIKEAESLIRDAEDFVERGKYREALAIAQYVNHIASEIETHKKLKALELAQATQTDKTELKASAIESVEVE